MFSSLVGWVVLTHDGYNFNDENKFAFCRGPLQAGNQSADKDLGWTLPCSEYSISSRDNIC